MKCACGCGHEVTHKHKKAIFAPHHKKSEKVKLRYQIARRAACEGTVPASAWVLCESCGEWFPVFFKLHGVEFTIRACPDFINPECGPRLRIQGMNQASFSRGLREKSKNFRVEICTRKGKICQSYSKCSDREFAMLPENRLWEYEKHGKDCYK